MGRRRQNVKTDSNQNSATTMRIVGGSFRGRKIIYAGDRVVRPMKDRTREAVFNLIGPTVKGTHVIDLFAGTGAMALESCSRGASSGTLIERHVPSANTIRENFSILGLHEVCELFCANVFLWSRKGIANLPNKRWLIFCCPPYSFFTEKLDELIDLLHDLAKNAPADSLLVVEAEIPFDFADLKLPGEWKTRTYRPAEVGILDLNPTLGLKDDNSP